jgi:hypothetical protein
LIVACLIAIVAATAIYAHSRESGNDRSDFSQALFGARALLHGANPYVLVGPTRVYESQWPVMYPATAYAFAIPFAGLSDGVAAALFVAASTFLLVYGMTAGTWHRLPMLASIAFLSSVQLAQWSIVITAMLFLPVLAALAAVKPQAAFPVIASSPSRVALTAALIGGLVLLAVSIALLPSWPLEWWRIVRETQQLRPPIMRLGGPLILLVLLRWRRPEAWLVFLMACMPQSWAWYNALTLLAIATTYREACVLSLVSSAGGLAAVWYIRDSSSPASYPAWGAALVAFAYLPATIAVLRRPNVKEGAPWRSKEIERMGDLRD